jgi:hypothetical protein
MKRSIIVAALALAVAAGAQAASSVLDDFKTVFNDIAAPMAGGLTIDSTAGNNWSDAWIGSFPHFGVGITTGYAFIAAEQAEALFESLGEDFPSQLKGIGIPLPTVVGTLKVGIPFLPMDIGIKGGYLPTTSLKQLIGETSSVNYTNIGIQLRYALVKQTVVLPNVSVGVAYDYQQAKLSMDSGLGATSYSFDTPSGSATVNATSPTIYAGWDSSTLDITAQVSKKFIFIVPYFGAGLTLGKTSVNGGINSTISTTYPGGLDALNSILSAAGGPTLSSTGIAYTVSETDPLFRLYGGFSLRAAFFDIIDIQGLYVPQTGSLGATITARLQF